MKKTPPSQAKQDKQEQQEQQEKFYARFVAKPKLSGKQRRQQMEELWFDDDDEDEDEDEYVPATEEDTRQAREQFREKSLPEHRASAVNPTRCPAAKKCSGCQMQNLPYEDGLRWKQAQVKKLLGSFGRIQPIIGMDDPTHYRNKVQVAFGMTRNHRIISGIWQSREQRIAAVDRCMIEDRTASEIAITIRKLLPAFKMTAWTPENGGFLRHVLIRRGFATGQIMVVLVAGTPIFPSKKNFTAALLRAHPEITTVVFTVNESETNLLLGKREEVLYGNGYIEDTLCGLTFRISPKSFYQVNPVQTEVLYQTALEYAGLTGKERVLDAYCGIGTIGLAAAGKAGQVLGIEVNPDAVADAEKNAVRNGVKNAEFVCADAGEYMTELAQLGEKVDVLFMDPPRAGADKAFLQAALTCAPEKIVYISCNPETQARDLAMLTAKKGYRVVKMQPVDMFPWTHHVENVALLEKVQPKAPKPTPVETKSAPKQKADAPVHKHTRPSRRSQFARKNNAAFGKSGKAVSDKKSGHAAEKKGHYAK